MIAVQFVQQRDPHEDCGIATLAMFTGVTYEDALAAAVQFQPAALHEGLTWSQMKRAAKLLGTNTRIIRKYDITTATGILWVEDKSGCHVVYLWAGRIVDGDGECWLEPAAYLKKYKYKPKSLMVAVE